MAQVDYSPAHAARSPRPDGAQGNTLTTALEIETPEGAEIALRPAGVFARGMALVVDELIRWGILSVGSLVLGAMGALGQGMFLLLVFVVYWFYSVGFEVYGNGQTPGKRVQGIAVVHDDGTPIRLPASMVRNLLLTVDVLPVFYVAGLVSMVLTRHFRRIGDLVAGTLVVYRGRPEARPELDEGMASAPPFELTLADQQTLMAFAERSGRLSPARARELADILAPVLGCSGERAVRELKRIANGLWGAT